MSLGENTALKFRNYKSFDERLHGFDKIAPINIVIGRNNSGKSAILDLVGYVIQPYKIDEHGHIGKSPSVYFSNTLDQTVIERVYPRTTGGGPISGNHYQYGTRFMDKIITVELTPGNGRSFESIDSDETPVYSDKLATLVSNPFDGKLYKRVLAERDIVPEPTGEPVLQSDGVGASNLIRHFLLDSSADQKMVEDRLLSALNEIFEPDTSFSRIQAKRLADDRWEIFLEEEQKGSIALSNSGSGLKTVMIVLAQTILSPILEDKKLDQFVFGFEELENNLHPGLQRRLLEYLRKLAVENHVTMFITTHSNVVIDMFSADDQAQISHVNHNKKSAEVKTLQTYHDGNGVLDDLDIRASDILQSNGIIWVEGPSDRTYINRYIELISDGRIREGRQYQIMFYGGRLLAQITADPTSTEHANLLNINRHTSLVIDSDRRKPRQRINATKSRMKAEVEEVSGYVWITDGKEIENSIPVAALRTFYENPDLVAIGEYELFDEYLDKIEDGEGRAYLRSKSLFAENLAQHITKSMVESDADLLKHVKHLCRHIESWNGGS